MSSSREDLLSLLQDARVSSQETEQLLRYAIAHHSAPTALLPKLDTLLMQVIDQQQRLAQSVSRILDTASAIQTDSPCPATTCVVPDAIGARHASILPDLRDAMLQDIDRYAMLIDTAESAGFFETKLICQGILAQTSSAFEWLALGTPPGRP